MAGKYQAYPEYKDSDVDWLEKLPVHWELSKLRYMFSFGKGLTITKENLSDEGVPCVNYGEVHSKYGFEVDPSIHPLKCVSENYIKSSPSALLTQGDLVFADTSEDIEGSGNFTQLTSDETVFAGYHTIIARPNDRQCSRFYAYLLDSLEIRTQIRHAVKGVKVFSVTQAILRGVDIWQPSLEERKKIASFLDHETDKIDTLIEKQQQLIKLLKEKRQAVISHAVTKGLNPNAPMRDSGVEWLGDVPEHWIVVPLHRIVQSHRPITYGIVQPGEPDEGGRFMIRNQDFSSGWVRGDSIFRVSDAIEAPYKRARMEPNDLVMTIVGAVGNVGIIPDWLDGANTTQNLARIAIDSEKADPFYIAAVLQGPIGKRNVDRYSKGGVQAALNLDHIRRFILPVPPLDEQREMTTALQYETGVFDSLEQQAKNIVELLQERRTALISAAVTGKIDIRNWVASEPSNTNNKEVAA